MVASLHTPKSIVDMMAGFPAMPHAIDGEPNLRGLFRVLMYMQACAQSHKTSYDPLNMLYLASDEGSYHVLARYLRNDDGTYHTIDGKKVKQVACGFQHTVCLTEDGDVYSWGLSRFGALG